MAYNAAGLDFSLVQFASLLRSRNPGVLVAALRRRKDLSVTACDTLPLSSCSQCLTAFVVKEGHFRIRSSRLKLTAFDTCQSQSEGIINFSKSKKTRDYLKRHERSCVHYLKSARLFSTCKICGAVLPLAKLAAIPLQQKHTRITLAKIRGHAITITDKKAQPSGFTKREIRNRTPILMPTRKKKNAENSHFENFLNFLAGS